MAYLLGAYVLAYADLVLILQVAGLANALNRWAVMALQLLLSGCAFVLWVQSKRPPLLAAFLSPRRMKVVRDWRSVLKLVLIGSLAAAVGYVYLRQAQLILVVPPDEIDSMMYHLPRVGFWLQHHSLYPWPTPDPRQTSLPINGELGLLWTILWAGTDRFAGFVQWSTVPVIMIGIAGLVRLLGYSRWQGAMTGLLWATLTQVLDQSITTQNDLVTTAFWVCALFFFLAGLQQRKSVGFLLSGMAFGLAMGAKTTSLIVLLGLGFALTIVIVIYRRQMRFRALLIRWVAACILGFFLFGSFIYVQNQVVFGNLLGPLASQSITVGLRGPGAIPAYAARLRDNLGRYIYQLVDFSPLPYDLASRLNPLKAAFFSPIYGWLGISVGNSQTMMGPPWFDLGYINGLDRNSSWFGPLTAILVVAVIYQGYQGMRRRNTPRVTLATTALAFLILESAAETWFPYLGRRFQTPVALAFPLMACFLQVCTVWRAALASVQVLLGVSTMFTVALPNGVLASSAWRDTFAAERRDPSWANEFNYRMIMENVPSRSSIGVVSTDDFRDYPLFGEHFTRRVNQAIPDDMSIVPRMDTQRFVQDFEHSDYLFVAGGATPSIPPVASRDFYVLSNDGHNSLWIRKDLRAPNECDGHQWPFAELFHSSSATVCPSFPISPGLTGGGDARTLFLRDGHLVPVIAPGADGELAFDLLVKNSAEVKLSIQVVPRPSNVRQTLQLALSSGDSRSELYSASFSKNQVLGFTVPLQLGTYRMHLGLGAGSTEASVLKVEAAAR